MKPPWGPMISWPLFIVVFIEGSLSPRPAIASNQDARFALHRVPVSEPFDGCGSSSPNAQGVSCADYTVTAPLGDSYVYVLVGQTGDEGVWGVSFGVDYEGRPGQMEGIDPELATFTYCNGEGLVFEAGAQYGEFPAPQGAVSVTFVGPAPDFACYEHPVVGASGRHVLVGYFYLHAYSEDVLRLTDNGLVLSGDELAVTACDGTTVNLIEQLPRNEWRERLGRVHFGGNGSEGYTPCGMTPVRTTTWGAIKILFSASN